MLWSRFSQSCKCWRLGVSESNKLLTAPLNHFGVRCHITSNFDLFRDQTQQTRCPSFPQFVYSKKSLNLSISQNRHCTFQFVQQSQSDSIWYPLQLCLILEPWQEQDFKWDLIYLHLHEFVMYGTRLWNDVWWQTTEKDICGINHDLRFVESNIHQFWHVSMVQSSELQGILPSIPSVRSQPCQWLAVFFVGTWT